MLGDREPASILRLLLWRLHAERGESSSGNGVAYGGVSCTLPEEHEKRSQGRDESDIPCCSRIHSLSLSPSLFQFVAFISAGENLRPRKLNTAALRPDRTRRRRAFTWFEMEAEGRREE